MIYRTYTLETLDVLYQTSELKETLTYATSGAVSSYNIDDDYMVANNSEITIITKTSATVGQVIVLIESSGVYALGVVTAVDNEKLRIMYKSVFDLFDDNVLNPARNINLQLGLGDIKVSYYYDAILDTASILKGLFGGETQSDRHRRLPLIIRTSGGGVSDGNYNEPAIWDYTENSFNVREWLVSLFNNNNVVVQSRLVFELSRAYIELYIFKNSKGGRLIKNNIAGMNITQQESRTPKATVCQVIYSSDKTIVPDGLFYLLQDNTVTTDMNNLNRVLPYKLVVSEFDKEQAEQDAQDNKPVATPLSVAESNLKYKDYAHYINLEIDSNSAMYPSDLNIGDSVTIVPEILENTLEDKLTQNYADYLVDSIYTGRKESSDSSRVTLLFGKIRVNYTDLQRIER